MKIEHPSGVMKSHDVQLTEFAHPPGEFSYSISNDFRLEVVDMLNILGAAVFIFCQQLFQVGVLLIIIFLIAN